MLHNRLPPPHPCRMPGSVASNRETIRRYMCFSPKWNLVNKEGSSSFSRYSHTPTVPFLGTCGKHAFAVVHEACDEKLNTFNALLTWGALSIVGWFGCYVLISRNCQTTPFASLNRNGRRSSESET